MLATLRIRNLALVADMTVDFRAGYNVITGETGAGKSILIGALNLVLGERADRTLIRSGAESCSVEAVFDAANVYAAVPDFLGNHGLEPCEGGQLVVKRTFTTAGTNRQFINGTPTTLQILAALGESLVDIHGPYEHQSLIHPAKQLVILDAFGGLHASRERFVELVRRREALLAEKATLIIDEQTYARQLELLRFQLKEISAAKLRPNEEEQLELEYRRANNAAKLLELARAAQALISEDEGSMLNQAGALGRTLQELKATDPSSESLFNVHGQIVAALQDLQHSLSGYTDRVELDPERLQQLQERLDLIHSLKRKYGKTLAAVIEFGEEARRKLQSLEQRDAALGRINAELAKLNADSQQAGQELSARRRKVIPRLCREVGAELTALGFKQSRFEVAITSESEISNFQSQISPSGFDIVEFQFAPNVGEPPRALRAIASSGEMARVMLALKTVLAAEDEIPVLVFDEVDANVGGETAHAVGAKMRQIAQKRQVLCITHLAPVAAPADAHYLITKEIKDSRTVSQVTLLDAKNRVRELARMLGEDSTAALQLAESLLRRENPPSRSSR
ncbi:MAG: DNA repair protein RecN [Verrucomicrobia bacterium]|nr:DNA repair protein RecN [Verrucomicrobiota bacterium]